MLDQQLLQAGESVKQAQANLNYAKVTAARYNDLAKTNAVSQQDVDNFNSQEKVQEGQSLRRPGLRGRHPEE